MNVYKWVSDSKSVDYSRIVARVISHDFFQYLVPNGNIAHGRYRGVPTYKPSLYVVDAFGEYHRAFMDDYGTVWSREAAQ